MRATEAARPAHRRCDDGPREIEHRAALSFFDTALSKSLQECDFADANAPVDLRLLGVDWNDCDKALADCAPLVLDRAIYNKLFGLGISGAAINGRGPFGALHIDAVVFLPSGRFEFSRDMRDASGTVKAVIIPVHDEQGELMDLAAWKPGSKSFGLWRGAASILGADRIGEPRVDSPVLHVFPDILSWLRNNRCGVVIIDPARARWLLAGDRLVVDATMFGARLREELRLPEPQIFVRTAA
jgi:hypothetical protein